MKIKIFRDCTIGVLESDINNWLKQNQPILIIRINQSESRNKDGFGSITISIWYEDSDFISTFDSNINSNFNGSFV